MIRRLVWGQHQAPHRVPQSPAHSLLFQSNRSLNFDPNYLPLKYKDTSIDR